MPPSRRPQDPPEPPADAGIPGRPGALAPLRDGDRALLSCLIWIYLALIPTGTLLLRHGALQSGQIMNFDRAVFWALNALTGTGFRLSPNGLGEFSLFGQVTVFALTLAGAMLILSAGGLLVSRYVGLAYSRAKILTAAFSLLLAGTLLGGGLLITPSNTVWSALFAAGTTITNAGLSIDGPRDLFDARLFLIILPLAALGGLGLPVVIDLFEAFARGGRINHYTRQVLTLTAAAWVAAFAVLFVCNLSLPLRENAASSWLYALNARSLGLDVTLDTNLTRQAWWVIGLLSLIGACPGGSAGGIKLTIFSTIATSTRKLFHVEQTGRSPQSATDASIVQTPQLFHVEQSARQLATALIWASGVLSIAFALFLLLLAAVPQLPADRIATIAASAIGRAGLSHDELSLTGVGLYLLSLAMLAGHLLPVLFGMRIVYRGGEMRDEVR